MSTELPLFGDPSPAPVREPPPERTDDSRSLNPEQRAAVEHVEGPLLVLAGAGSGKTRVLTVRIAQLIREHGVPPARILAVTFTNKAAGEMRQRIRALLGRDPAGAWIGTFHSLGARFLRRHADRLGWDSTFSIYDAEQSLREMARVMEAQKVDQKQWRPKAVQGVISEAKNQMVTPAAFASEHEDGVALLHRVAARVYPEYQRSLKQQNAFDFDDLLVKPVELLESAPDVLERYQERFQFILVDEYQDTNHAQFRLLEALGRRHRNMMVVGDDDQSIYGWRGADIRNILDFERTFPGATVVRLEQNYRSTRTILGAANAVIRRNQNRKEKTLRTEREDGVRIQLIESRDERDEATTLAREIETLLAAGEISRYRDTAILYRTNAQSRALEDAFRRRGIPYQIVGGVRFYERREIQDVMAYLRLISNPRDNAAFERAVGVPKRGVGSTSLDRFGAWCADHGLSLLEGASRLDQVPGLPPGAMRGIERFSALIGDFQRRAVTTPVGPLIQELVERLDFAAYLRSEGRDREGPDGEERVLNVEELIAGAMDFEAHLGEEADPDTPPTLTELDLFLQQVALVTDIDRHDPDADAVTLMTLHNAKGLEYPVVFISGLEDGLFPLARAYEEPALLEEERRLFYVGITRARNALRLSWANERRRGGSYMVGVLSSFVDDIPEALLSTRRSSSREPWEGMRYSSDTPPAPPRPPARYSAESPDEDPSAVEAADLAVEGEMNQDLPDLRRGERVRHPTFGAGRVVDVSGSGRDVKVVVDFGSVGRKKLVARFAGLEREGE